MKSVRQSALAVFIFTSFVLLPGDNIISKDLPVHTVIVNLGDSGDRVFCTNWLRVLNYQQINNWGRGMGMTAIPDRAPVIDGRARFVSRFGSVIRISGLRPNRTYRMWIDFVVFQKTSGENISARLDILIDNKQVASLNYGDVNEENNPYIIEIPRDCTIDGAIEILLRDYSPRGGFWGVWDVVVTQSYKLPEKAVKGTKSLESKERRMDVKSRLIERKKKLQKRKPERKKRKIKKKGKPKGISKKGKSEKKIIPDTKKKLEKRKPEQKKPIIKAKKRNGTSKKRKSEKKNNQDTKKQLKGKVDSEKDKKDSGESRVDNSRSDKDISKDTKIIEKRDSSSEKVKEKDKVIKKTESKFPNRADKKGNAEADADSNR